MLGCYVGPVGVAARGVPERFLDPLAPPPPAAAAAAAPSSASKTIDTTKVTGEGRPGRSPSVEGEKTIAPGPLHAEAPRASHHGNETRTEDAATAASSAGPALPAATPNTTGATSSVENGPDDAMDTTRG